MKLQELNPPRTFVVGNQNTLTKVCAHIDLDKDDLVTFTTAKNGEYDVARKEWGFYATPSLNKRVTQFGFKPLLVRSKDKTMYFIFLLEEGFEAELDTYLEKEDQEIVCVLDEATLKKIGELK